MLDLFGFALGSFFVPSASFVVERSHTADNYSLLRTKKAVVDSDVMHYPVPLSST